MVFPIARPVKTPSLRVPLSFANLLNMEKTLMLLLVAAAIFLCNLFRAPSDDRTTVAVTAVCVLLLAVGVDLCPVASWVTIAFVLCIANFALLVSLPVGILLLPFILFSGPSSKVRSHTSQNLQQNRRPAATMLIWTADVWGLWTCIKWLRSLPEESFETMLTTLLKALLPCFNCFPDIDATSDDFRTGPQALTLQQFKLYACSAGFFIIITTLALSAKHQIHERKLISPSLSSCG